MVFFLGICQSFFLFFINLIRWRNIRFGFSLKVIYRIWMFRVDGKHFILNESWWKRSQFIIVFFLELYQLFFLFYNFFIRWINLRFEFALQLFWWEHVWFSSRSSLIFFRLSSCLKKWSDVYCDTLSSLADKSIMILCYFLWYFLSTAEFILLLVYFFHPIVIDISSVFWLRNQSRVFFVL